MIGEDPFETEKLWHKMYRANIYGGRRGAGMHAISGIDIALWDIKGKALGLPVWKLLGRRISPEDPLLRQLPVRPHSGEDRRAGPPISRPGLHRRKVRLGSHGTGRKDRHRTGPRRPQGTWRDADLLIDAGLVWDSKTAMHRARAFSEYDIFWLEEPLRPDDYDGYRKLAEATHVRIAAGEEESNRAVVP